MIARSLASPPTSASARHGRPCGTRCRRCARSSHACSTPSTARRMPSIVAWKMLRRSISSTSTNTILPGERALDDAQIQLFAALRVQLLGIVQAVDRRAARRRTPPRRPRPGRRAGRGRLRRRRRSARVGRRDRRWRARTTFGADCAMHRRIHASGAGASSSSAIASAARAEASRRSARCSSRKRACRIRPRSGRRKQREQGAGELVRRAVVLHQLRHERFAGQHVRQAIAVRP